LFWTASTVAILQVIAIGVVSEESFVNAVKDRGKQEVQLVFFLCSHHSLPAQALHTIPAYAWPLNAVINLICDSTKSCCTN